MPTKSYIYFTLFFLGLSGHLPAQKSLVWQVLSLTTYQTHPESGELIPNFPAVLVRQYEGQEVSISGYLIPIDVAEKRYALSQNPYSACFFCGNAGPETVMELEFKEEPGRFATDQYVVLKGTLKLNRRGSRLFFSLVNAEFHG